MRFQPQFAEHCDWTKLTGDDWTGLLQVQPQLADKCDWEKLSAWEWKRLLSDQPQFAEQHARFAPDVTIAPPLDASDFFG